MPAPTAIQSTTQQFLDIFDITNDLLIMKDGSTALAITVSAINFGLFAEEEQDAVIYAYAGLLNSLNYPIQIVIKSQTKDVTSYLRLLQDQEEQTPSQEKRNRIRRYREFVSNLIHEGHVLDKKFYVVVPATALEMGVLPPESVVPGLKKVDIATLERSVLLEKARAILEPKRDHLINQFARLGLAARQLTTQEIIQLFYTSYNPEATEGQQITDTHSYTTPVVEAQIQTSLINQTSTSTMNSPSSPTSHTKGTLMTDLNQAPIQLPNQPAPAAPAMPLETPVAPLTPTLPQNPMASTDPGVSIPTTPPVSPTVNPASAMSPSITPTPAVEPATPAPPVIEPTSAQPAVQPAVQNEINSVLQEMNIGPVPVVDPLTPPIPQSQPMLPPTPQVPQFSEPVVEAPTVTPTAAPATETVSITNPSITPTPTVEPAAPAMPLETPVAPLTPTLPQNPMASTDPGVSIPTTPPVSPTVNPASAMSPAPTNNDELPPLPEL